MTRPAVDPITTEILRNAFISVAEEMNATLIRSAYTPIIYEMKDCSVALLDHVHSVLGQSSGLPIFLGNLEVCTRVTEEMLGADVWKPGDVWILNDSYLAGTHLHDQTVFSPIFHDAELVGFAASRAHWIDIGAKDPGGAMDATDIYQEGLRLGPTRIVAGGETSRDIVDILARNSRFPHSAIGDLHAQIAVARTGERRFLDILDRFGRETVAGAREEIFAQSERLDRRAIAAIPDGTYEAEGCLDNDGLSEEPVWVRAQIEVSGERMTIDLTRSSDATRGPINCGEAQTVSACRVAFKVLVNPQLPVNGGTFRPLSVRVRPGSFLAAQEPSPCGWYYSGLGLLIDLVVTALAPVLPTRAAAASYGDSMIINISGADERTGRPFLDLEPNVGGWGAWEGSDGESGLINNVNGAVKNLPIEVQESTFPLRVAHYGFREDSAGAGRWRGGFGIEREYVIDCAEAWLNLWFERSKTPAWGLFGGGTGEPPDVVVNPGRADERHLLKASMVPLRRGDVVRCQTGGGGGFGDPLERDPELVRADVDAGLLSPARAQRDYAQESRLPVRPAETAAGATFDGIGSTDSRE
jgi:N-methylhydantoinase B